MNTLMRDLLHTHGLDPFSPISHLDPGLQAIVSRGLSEHDGCWLLTELFHPESSTPRSAFPDDTGYEAFINHVHLDDVIDVASGELSKHLLKQGIAYAHALRELATPAGAFRIVLSVEATEPLNLGVRILRRRPGEGWLSNDLEQYREHAVLVIDTPAAGQA